MWQKVTGKTFAIVVCNFESDIPHSLKLTVGQRVHIKQQNGEWYYGHLSSKCCTMGLFPASHVHIVKIPTTDKPQLASNPHLKTPILEEVVVVLKEWSEIIRELDTNPNFVARKPPDMRGVFKKLAELRRDILSNQLTVQHQKDAKHSLVQLITEGNKNLNKFFEPSRRESSHGHRHPIIGVIPTVDGDVVDIDHCSIVNLHKIHTDCTKELLPNESWTLPRHTSLIETGNQNLSPLPTKSSRRISDIPAVYNIHFHLLHFACGVQGIAEVYFSLYDAKEKKFISERFLCRFNAHGTPLDPELIGNIMAVFTDLSPEDVSRDLYLTCHIIQPDFKEKKGNSVPVRRPYGCGVENLQDLLSNIGDEDKRHFKMKICSYLEGEFHQQHDMIIRGVDRACKQIPANIGIDYKLQVLQGQFETLIFNRKVNRVRKLGFSDIINPDDQRNDLYVILDSAKFVFNNKKAVQITVCAVDGTGQVLKCICHADSPSFDGNYESYTLTSGAAMRWNENIKFRMPATAFSEKENMHIRFEIRTISHKAKKLCGIAFIRLTKDDDTTVENGEHSLFVYKCPEQTVLKPADYIKLPASEYELPQRAALVAGNQVYVKNNNCSLTIQTIVCSTKLTQNGNVVQLLKWRTNMNKLDSVVENLHRVKGDDIVVVLSDILDSLFEILDLKKPQLEKPVFKALVYIINTLNHQRYKSFTSVLDNYLRGQFSSSTLHFFLLSRLTENIQHASDDTKFVKDMLLGLQHFFKLIFMSHTNLQQTAEVVDQLDIVEKIRDLIDSLNELMRMVKPNLEDLQLIVLQNAVAVYSEMKNMGIYTVDEVCQFTVDILGSINKRDLSPKLLLAKLNCILDTVRSPLFHDMSARRVFVRPIIPQLKEHLAKQDAVERCVDILSEMLSLLQAISNEKAVEGDPIKGKEEIDEDIGLISKEVMPSLLYVMNSRLESRDELKRQEVTKIMTCLLTLLSIMEEKHYKTFSHIFVDMSAKQEFLSKLFVGFNGICHRGIYMEQRWITMNMVCNRVMLRAIKYFSADLQSSTSDEGSLDLWREFFELTVRYVTQDCLKFEAKYSGSKKSQLNEKFGDLRLDMAQLMVSKWNSLGVHQVPLAKESMIRSFLDVSLVPDTTIRRVVMPLLFDVIKWEWQQQKDLSQLEMVLIDSVDDKVCRDANGDEKYAAIFREIMMEKLKTEDWREQGEELVGKVTKLFERLIDYRLSQEQRENRYLRLSATHSLIGFYKDEVIRDIYKRHIMALKEIHLEVNDYYEAACTLELHAKTLNWGENKKEHEMKERLYDEILQIVDKGKVWEYGIPILKELEEQYEKNFFDYPKVSSVLKKRAEFFEKISSSGREAQVYFKIDFYGPFPHVRSTRKDRKSFVFKGAPFDKPHSMLEKLQSDFPKARGWTNKEPPTEKDLADNQQYIEVRSVEPVPDMLDMFLGRDDVPQEIMHYYKYYKIKKFKFDRPFNRGEKDKNNELKTLWLERTVLTTARELPDLLVWSEIIDSQVYERTPLEKSLEDIESKIEEVQNKHRRHRSHQEEPLPPLTQVLNGTVDAAVMGGISKIREYFLSDSYLVENPDDAHKVELLKELINRQLFVLDEALTYHGTVIQSSLTELQDLLEKKLKHQFQAAGLSTRSNRVSRTSGGPSPGNFRGRTSFAISRTQSQFFVPLDQNSASTGIPSRKLRATMAAKSGPDLDFLSESLSTPPNRYSTISGNSSIAEEPEPTPQAPTVLTHPVTHRDSGIGSYSEISSQSDQQPPPPLPKRPTSTSSTSSHGSSNFSSSSNSRPASSEFDKVLDDHKPGSVFRRFYNYMSVRPKQQGPVQPQRPTTLLCSDDMNGDTLGANDHSPSPPPLPVRTSRRSDINKPEQLSLPSSQDTEDEEPPPLPVRQSRRSVSREPPPSPSPPAPSVSREPPPSPRTPAPSVRRVPPPVRRRPDRPQRPESHI
ncbi:dedicator of cytokinesis protein 3-like isoform X4 [Apostichopus japonicus]|uniref:dedicator of cytokinesis protein 3-like isoform X4 n=1 Tax=Stichopus japonicus TaxID=307972 RepID=UPI003AB18127